jgi:alkanesulfonate monooxygenase SsuD/methylene tetrahydromethanopterin reductase-like flavin-dependent oxidoreductase (luciferase family)
LFIIILGSTINHLGLVWTAGREPALPDREADFTSQIKSRLASSLRRREEVMEGTQLVDRSFPDEPPLEQIRDNLLIGDVDTVAEKLVAEIQATHPVHVCFSFKVGDTPHRAGMRSMELMIGEVKPKVERVLGSLDRAAAQ